MTNAHLIQWNDSHSTFEIIGHFDTYKQARQRLEQIKRHPNYCGQDISLIGNYELGYLEAVA